MNTEETNVKNTDEYIEELFCGRGLCFPAARIIWDAEWFR